MPDVRELQQEPLGPVVFIVDDDLSIREALTDLFRSMKFEAEAFESATAFMETANFNRPGCILLDVRLPGVSGLNFQRAMKAGAVDLLTKPFKDLDILDAVAAAMGTQLRAGAGVRREKPLPRLRQASRHASARSRTPWSRG